MNLPAVRILGCRVHLADLPTALGYLAEEIGRGVRQFVVAQNPEKVMRSQVDAELAEILEKRATLAIADGVGLAIAGRLFGQGPIPRLCGVDLFQALLARAAQDGKTVFFYGSTPAAVRRAARLARTRHPGLRIAGTADGFGEDPVPPCEKIRRASPDFLFVGLGTPRQEKWIARRLDRLPVELAMGVGGSLDVLAGEVRRAPAAMRRAGLEWLYRLLAEPRRWRRMRVLPAFLWRVLRASGRARGSRPVRPEEGP